MRLLILSSFFPPARAGGYDQLCWEVVQALRSRGHKIAVLTSRADEDLPIQVDAGVYRLLYLDSDLDYYRPMDILLHWKRNQATNQDIFNNLIGEFRPDLVFIWGMWAISKQFVAYVESLLPDQVVYYLAGYWPVRESAHVRFWTQPARRWFFRLPKKILGLAVLKVLGAGHEPTLRFQHTICVSYALRRSLSTSGIPIETSAVIYNGIKAEDFFKPRRPGERREQGSELALLYAGQLARHKGVHTLIEALDIIRSRGEIESMQLVLIGRGHPTYWQFLNQLIQERRLEKHVEVRGFIPRTEMPAVFQNFDVFVLPSLYEEPLARVIQEAMAAGLGVIGTATGGTPEILHDGENGLIFQPGDAVGLADKILLFKNNPELLARLAAEGQQTVLEEYSLEKMVNGIQVYLQEHYLPSRPLRSAG